MFVMVKDGFIPFKCSNVESPYGQLDIGLAQSQVTLDDGDGNPSTAAVLDISLVRQDENPFIALVQLLRRIFGETVAKMDGGRVKK
jgi:hypothetical protein